MFHCTLHLRCVLASFLIAGVCDAQQPKDDDRVIWVANGSQPGERYIGMVNTGKKGQAHKIEVRFDFLGLPSGHGFVYDLRSITLDREVAHPKDSFGANLLPQSAEVFRVVPRVVTRSSEVAVAIGAKRAPLSIAGNNDSSMAVTDLQDKWYNHTSGLWDLQPGGTQWWNSANSLEMLCNYIIQSKSSHGSAAELSKVLQNTFDATSLSETLTGRYDDEGWWALAWMRAYEVDGDVRFLERAEAIFQDLAANAWDEEFCGGGVWWSYAKAYKNAITNELFIAMAAKLHLLTGGSCGGISYLDWAKKAWTWFNKSGMVNGQNLINDGLNKPGQDPPCANNGQTEWTYNQGVVLGGLAWLYKATKDDSLLAQGVAIANATITSLVWSDALPILKESCEFSKTENDCDADQVQFKGIFVRHLMYFCQHLPDRFANVRSMYESWIAKNFNAIWSFDRSKANLALTWLGPFGTPGAAVQTSATDVLIAHSTLSRQDAHTLNDRVIV